MISLLKGKDDIFYSIMFGLVDPLPGVDLDLDIQTAEESK